MNNKKLVQFAGLTILFSLLLTSSFGTVAAVGNSFDLSTRNGSNFETDGPVPTPGPRRPAERLAEEETTSAAETTSGVVTLGAWRNLRPTENFLRGVSMLPDTSSVNCSDPDQKSKGWIVGDDGIILSYCNGYWDHAISVESVPNTLWDVQALAPDLAVAVGDQGTVLMYLWDKVAQDWVWTKSPIPVGNEILLTVSMIVDGKGGYTGWAAGSQDANGRGTLVRGTITPTTVDGHSTYLYSWENQTANFPGLPEVDFYNGLQMLSPNNGWLVGGKDDVRGVILHWDGVKWSLDQEVGTKRLVSVYMLSETEGWAVGFGGVIYHYNGASWQQVPSPTTKLLVDVLFSPGGDGWAVGRDGTILKYVNGSWELFSDLRTDPFDFKALSFSGDHGWMVGFNEEKGMGGQILEYEDGLWLAVTPPTDNRLNKVTVVSDTDAWAVGNADSSGGTIIHWDGKHWQRWYQDDLSIPPANLYAIDMASETEGWAAGDPLHPGEPAVFLRWDGHRWYQPRYMAPVNVRVNDLTLLDQDAGADFGGWAVADSGNAVAKWDGSAEYWSANHTFSGYYYQLRSASIVTSTANLNGWDAWAVGHGNTGFESFLRYQDRGESYAWDVYQSLTQTSSLRGIQMQPDPTQPGSWGYAVGNYKDGASIYSYNNSTRVWDTIWGQSEDSNYRPGQLNSVDITQTGIGWFGGFYTDPFCKRKEAYILYRDSLGLGSTGTPLPWQPACWKTYPRPIASLKMASDTMGWAVGDGEDPAGVSVIYQYPFPNFTLEVSPKFRAVLPGDAAYFTISAYSIGGFGDSITLDAPYLPAGISASINPATVDSDTSGSITLTTSPVTPLGVYEIPIWGSSSFRSGDYKIPVLRMVILRLTVTDHPLYSLSPSSGPAGTLVTLSGKGFGPDPGPGQRSTAQNHVTLAGAQMPDASVVSWSGSQIRVRVPDDPSLFPKGPQVGEVSVTAGGTQSNANLSFQLENHLQGLSIQNDGDGYLATLTGTSFGNDPGPLFRSTQYEHVNLGGTWIVNDDVIAWSNNTIQFKLGAGASSGMLSVASNGFTSNSLSLKLGSGKVYLPLLMAKR